MSAWNTNKKNVACLNAYRTCSCTALLEYIDLIIKSAQIFIVKYCIQAFSIH